VPVITKVPRYRADSLVGTVTLAAAPDLTAGSYYELSFDTPTCRVLLELDPSLLFTETGYVDTGSCDPAAAPTDPLASSSSFGFDPVVSGNTITFEIPFAQLAAAGITTGTKLSGIKAYTGVADPTSGDPTVTTIAFTADDAATDTTYTVS
jgi:hypothetical protein